MTLAGSTPNLLARVHERLIGWIEWVVCVVLLVNVGLVCVSVIFRYLLNHPLIWSDEASRWLLVAITFLGAAVATGREQNMAFDLFSQRVRGRQARALAGLRRGLIAALMLALISGGMTLVAARSGQLSDVLQVPTSTPIVVMMVGAVLIVAITSLQAVRSRTEAVTFAITTAIAVSGTVVAQDFVISLILSIGVDPLLAMIATVIVLLLIGLPVAFVLGWGAFAFFLSQGRIPLVIFAQQAEYGVDSAVLLAVPFFIFAGALMEASGISRSLVEFLTQLVGKLRGGLGVVMVAAMVVFSGISGSKAADMAAVGSVLIPSMAKSPDGRSRPVALLAASAAMGEIIPPSLALLVLASVTTISTGDLLLAGILPSLVIAALLAAFVVAEGRLTGTRPVMRARSLPLFLSATPALGMPVGLVVPIVAGIATATEVSGLAVIYGLLIGAAKRELSRSSLRVAFGSTVALTGSVLIIISFATTFSYVIVVQQIPVLLAQAAAGVGGGQLAFFAVTVVVLVLMGAVLEGLPALVIFGPILVPVATALHISPVHYGIVLILSMGIGAFTPPLGIGLYIACSVGRTAVADVIRPLTMYLLVVALGLAIVIAFPALSTSLPHLRHH
jgi:C4-dicarboxylate transporter, DctM subunit